MTRRMKKEAISWICSFLTANATLLFVIFIFFLANRLIVTRGWANIIVHAQAVMDQHSEHPIQASPASFSSTTDNESWEKQKNSFIKVIIRQSDYERILLVLLTIQALLAPVLLFLIANERRKATNVLAGEVTQPD